jgi:ABC-2 type transport system ATP-binding protein
VVCEPVRQAFAILKTQPSVREVQLFGDRLNVVIDDAGRDMPALASLLQASGIAVRSQRRVVPSLENVFISLLTHPHSEMVAS